MNEQQNDPQIEDDNVIADKSAKDTSLIYFGDSTLQTKAEFDLTKNEDHTKEDNKVTASESEDLPSDGDYLTGADRAGTAEGKEYGDIELNKGLEAQAMDEES